MFSPEAVVGRTGHARPATSFTPLFVSLLNLHRFTPMHTCPWCTTSYVNWQSQCRQCGGPLAPPLGQGLGPQPPPAPRKLPTAYVRRVRWTQNIATMIGPGFAGIGLLFSLPMVVNKLWQAVFPMFFVVGGVSMFVHGWKIASSRLRAFRFGKAVEGKIYRVQMDTTQHVNGRHPLRVIYHFPVEGQMQEGVITSFDTTAARRDSGQPVWVLYNETDPAENAIFPPLS